jgi:predicted ArsR family transcriptional regulator
MESRGGAELGDVEALSVLGDRTRRRLYEFVAQSGRPVGRDECGQATETGRSLAAYHLDKLVEHGLLEASYARPAGRTGPGAGRPAKLYRRADREFVLRTPARDYRLLAELLARATEEHDGVKVTIEHAARELGRCLAAAGVADDPRRPEQALQDLLRRCGYEPFESEPGVVRLRNCPFDEVALRHPELVCGLNLALIDGMLAGFGAERANALLAPQEGACCVAIEIDAFENMRNEPTSRASLASGC